MSKKQLFMLTIIFSLLCLLSRANIQAAVPYQNYIYNYWGQKTPSPQAYVPKTVIDGYQLGLGYFSMPEDVFVSGNTIYLLDSGNNRIVVLASDWSLVKVIEGFENAGVRDTFSNPKGIFVNADQITVADTNNQRIVKLDHDGNLLRIINDPLANTTTSLEQDFVFYPAEVVVDPFGRIFVISSGCFEGILSLDQDGNFTGFIGAPRVRPTLGDLIWSKIGTEQQKSRRMLFLPTEFSGMAIDDYGFIFATSAHPEREDVIVRLSPAGVDTLRREGFVPPRGDLTLGENASLLADITARGFGGYSALDRNNNRVFTYDQNGNLLYVFGGVGNQVGNFLDAVAIEVMQDEQLLVVDRERGLLVVYEPTGYAQSIHQAISAYNVGDYRNSIAMWEQTLLANVNFDLAYQYIGRGLLMSHQYQTSLNYFQLGNYRRGYSRAFQFSRKQFLEEYFGTIVFVLGAIFALLAYLSKQNKRKKERDIGIDLAGMSRIERTLSGLRYSIYIAFHPFDGFWDLKHEKRGNVFTASIILAAVCLTFVFLRQYTGFLFNNRILSELNIYLEVASIFIPFMLWCIVNWAVSTLKDGKGRLKDIYIASAYALTPFILINIPAVIFSNYIILEEGTFFYLLLTISVIWSFSLMYCGVMVIHEYSFAKNLLTVLGSFIGIGIVIFIVLLCSSILAQLTGFVIDAVYELRFRL